MATRKPYPSDVSDEEWEFVAPYLALVREDAPQRNHDLREVFNGLRWVVRTGSPGDTCHTTCHRGRPSINRRSGGSKRECSRRWPTTCAYFCGFRKAGHPSLRRPYSTPAPCAQPPRAALGAVMTEPSARKARRYTLRWTLWDTCSPYASARPQSRSGSTWASWSRPFRKRPESRWNWPTSIKDTLERKLPKRRSLMA